MLPSPIKKTIIMKTSPPSYMAWWNGRAVYFKKPLFSNGTNKCFFLLYVFRPGVEMFKPEGGFYYIIEDKLNLP